jgi:hypothetical protein
MIKTLLLVVNQCILNQSNGFWLLFDALLVAFTLVQLAKTSPHNGGPFSTFGSR